MIRHPKYGRGTVLRREGDGEDAKLTVSFPGYGLKKRWKSTQESKKIKHTTRMNTKTITDRAERKKLKRTARKKAAPKAKRASGVARGS